MGKQIKNWTPPSDAVVKEESSEPKAGGWTPPADAVLKDDVKKKESATPSASGNVSGEPGQPSAKNSDRNTPTDRLRGRIEDLKTFTQRTFENEAKKKLEELQAQATDDPKQIEELNRQYREFVDQRAKTHDQDMQKWLGIYADRFTQEQKEAAQADFEANRERNPLASFGKTAWITLSKDLPAAGFGAKALTGSAVQKLDQKVIEGIEALGVEPLDTETASKIEQMFNSAVEFFTGEKMPEQKQGITREEAGNRVIMNSLREAVELSQASAEAKKYLVNSLDKIKNGDFIDWMNYASSAIGQGVAQIPTSVMTFGASSIIQQTGNIYLDSVQKIAQENGMTVEEVIKQGKDDVLYPLLFGVGTGLLDAIGAKGVAGAVSKKEVLDSFRKRALAIAKAMASGGGRETATEAAQTALEQIGVSKAAGKTWEETLKDYSWAPVIEGAVQGGIAGMFLAGGGRATSIAFGEVKPRAQAQVETQSAAQAVVKATSQVDPANPATAENAAEQIENAVPDPTTETQETTTQTQDGPDGNQSTSAGEGGGPVPATEERTDVAESTDTATPETAPEPVGETDTEQAKPEAVTTIKTPDGNDFPKENISIKGEGATQRAVVPLGNLFSGEKGFKGIKPTETLFLNQGEKYGRVNLVADEDFIRAYRYGTNFAKGKPSNVSREEATETAKKYGFATPMALADAVKQAAREDRMESEDVVIDFRKPTIEQATPAKRPSVTLTQEMADQLQALTDSGDIRREGNRVVPVTEKGRTELQKIRDGETQQSEKPRDAERTSEQRAQPVPDDGQPGKETDHQSNDQPAQTQESQAPPAEQPPSPPASTPPPATAKESPKARTYRIAQRIFASDADERIKRGVREKGAQYIPKGIDVTSSEADNLIELYGDDRAETLVRDAKSDLTPDTRTAIAAKLYERWKRRGDEATDEIEKQTAYNRAIDIALASAEQLKEAGRGVNAAKIWKQITATEDMMVMAVEKEVQKQQQAALSPIADQVAKTREQIDEEIRRIVEQRVTEQVEERLKRAKLITEQQKKKIANTLDSLKIKTSDAPKLNNIFQAAGEGAILAYNGSIEAVKRAILAGADVANAIQAGIDYIRDNYSGEWDEGEYRSSLTPAVEQLISETQTPKKKVNKKVKAEEIDTDKIKTPKLSGRKRKNFLDDVLDAHNDGKLTDDKFNEIYAKHLGVKTLTDQDRSRIRELAKVVADAEKFADVVKNDFTRENIAKYQKLLDEARKVSDELAEYSRQPSVIWDTLISIMQGNLLTPLSLATNIYSNAALQPMRFTSTAIGSLIDYSLTQASKLGLLSEAYQDRTIDLVALQQGYFSGGWNGILEGLKQLKDGPRADERDLREINNQFNAIKALQRIAEGNPSLKQKVNDYIEGTVGIPAEVMFRLLNLGDKPFRRAAEMARAIEIAKLKGLKGAEMERFIMFPDETSAAEIRKAGLEATFQQETESVKVVQRVLNYIINGIGKTPIVGGILKVIAKSQIPYVKTPWNIMTETLQYAAFPITGAVGIQQLVKGNKRGGSILLGKAITGALVFAVAKQLFQIGLLSWDEPYDQQAGKQRERRQMQYDNIPPNSINISALNRGLVGQGFEMQDDDIWINYQKLGIMGLLFDNYSNNYFANIREKGQMPEESEFWVDMFTSAPRVMAQSLDQSFLKGTNTLLTALQEGGGHKTDQWLLDTSGALSAIVYPNTISTISKSSDEFVRDTRADSFWETMKNTYKVKLFSGEDLPPKVNLWGEKITGQPEGRDKYVYYLFDVTKFKEVDTENFKWKLYEAWKGDKFSDEWLPTIPQRRLSYKKFSIRMSPEDYSQFCEYVGQERARLVSNYVNSGRFAIHDRDRRLKTLEELYSKGRERGKKRFLMDSGWNILTREELSKMAEK